MSAPQVHVLELRSVRGTGGGPEKTIFRSAAMANRDRVRVTVCYLRDQRDQVYSIDQRADAAHVDYVEILERHSFDREAWAKLRALVTTRRIDIVHAHEYKTDLLALMLARSTGVKALATAHGWTGHSLRERWCYYPADKRLLARFSRVIAVSSDIKQQIVKRGGDPSRITTILNAIDHQQFRRDPSQVAAARSALGLADSHIAIGAVGRLEPQKRFDLLLKAFHAVRRQNPNIRLIIAGDGSRRRALDKQIATLGLRDHVIMTGHVSDVRPIHHALDLFVQSSDYEGTPNAVLEAMAMETPVLATAAGGTAELVHDGREGRIVPIGDLEALIDGMEAAAIDPDTSRVMARQARRRVECELSFESRVRRVESIYVDMMQTPAAFETAYA